MADRRTPHPSNGRSSSKETSVVLNGVWSLMLKIVLACFVPWSGYITVETVLGSEFRKTRPLTPADALLLIHAHEDKGHESTRLRVTNLEESMRNLRNLEAEERRLLLRIADNLEKR